MNADDRRRIMRGEVFFEGRWVPIDRKLDAELQRRKKIEAGYVFYKGSWITIDEKLAISSPAMAAPATAEKSSTVVINNYDNRTVYTIDNRTVHKHEHRHVHLGEKEFETLLRDRLPGKESAEKRPPIAPPEGAAGALPAKEIPGAVEDGRKVKGLLEPPRESG